MATVRYLVDDIDVALPFYRALGFRLSERWGPPFAIVKRRGLALWPCRRRAPVFAARPSKGRAGDRCWWTTRRATRWSCSKRASEVAALGLLLPP